MSSTDRIDRNRYQTLVPIQFAEASTPPCAVGLFGVEGHSGVVRGKFRSKQGTLWFITADGPIQIKDSTKIAVIFKTTVQKKEDRETVVYAPAELKKTGEETYCLRVEENGEKRDISSLLTSPQFTHQRLRSRLQQVCEPVFCDAASGAVAYPAISALIACKAVGKTLALPITAPLCRAGILSEETFSLRAIGHDAAMSTVCTLKAARNLVLLPVRVVKHLTARARSSSTHKESLKNELQALAEGKFHTRVGMMQVSTKKLFLAGVTGVVRNKETRYVYQADRYNERKSAVSRVSPTGDTDSAPDVDDV
ncbi:MAG: hypothetical protein ACKVOH_04170 [Chlamydiales bacterium]